jgi:hypothetical protein
MGNIITASNALNLKETQHPRAYHGPDYYELVGCHNAQISNLADYVHRTQTEFVNLTDMYEAYKLICQKQGVQIKYVKKRDTFRDEFTKAISKHYPGTEYSIHNMSSGTSKGWRFMSNGKKCVSNILTLTEKNHNGQTVIVEEHELPLFEHDRNIQSPLIITTVTPSTDSNNDTKVVEFKKPTQLDQIRERIKKEPSKHDTLLSINDLDSIGDV